MTLDSRSSHPAPIRVTTLARALRIYVVTVFGLGGGFFIWLAWHEPTHGHEMGYVLGCVMLWMALWAAMRPEYAVVVNDSGFEYADERWGLLLYFTRRQAMWSDVTRVDTRMIRGRYGRWLRTRIWVRDTESGSGTRRFSIRSRSMGYQPFIDLLAARIAGQPVEMTGYGLDTQRAMSDDRLRRRQRAALAVAMMALAIAAIMLALHRR